MAECQNQRAGDEQRVVGEERQLRVFAAAHQKRRDESTDDGDEGERLRPFPVGGERCAEGDEHHAGERRADADQLVEAQCRVDRRDTESRSRSLPARGRMR